MSSFILSFFLFYFLFYRFPFIESLFNISLCHHLFFVTLSPYLSRVSPLIQTLEIPLLYGILIITDTLSPNLSCVSPLTQTLEMPLLYGILIVIDRLQPPHLLTSHFFSINFQLFSVYKLIGMVFNVIVS